MSLIYDALNDLEKRGALPSENVQKTHFDATDVEGAGSVPKFAVFFLIVFSIYLVAAAFHSRTLFSQGSDRGIEVTQVTTGKNSEEKVLTAKDLVTSQVEKLSVDEEIVRFPPPAISNDADEPGSIYFVSELLDKAALSLAQKRLTTPKEDSAYHYYTKVIELDPGNLAALDGLQKVRIAYLDLYQAALEKGNSSASESYKNKLFSITPDEEKDYFDSRIGALDIEKQQSSEMTSAVDETAAFDKAPSLEKEIAVASVAIQKSGAQLKEEWAAKVRALLDASDYGQAKTVIQDELDAGSKNISALLNLLEAYSLSKQFDKVVALVNMLPESATEYTFVYANALHKQGRETEAMQHLSSTYHHDEKSMAMYAGLLQKHKQFTQAKSLYSDLTQLDQFNALYWLGLAVSNDNLGDMKLAETAYLTALRLGGHSEAVQTFIVQRLNSVRSKETTLELSQW